MADQKLSMLVTQLSRRTLEGKVPWQKTVDDNKFLATFRDGFSVQISTRPSRDQSFEADSVDYVLTILDEDGDTVEEMSDIDFETQDLGENPYLVMKAIHTVARRTAMGAEKAINSILEELSDSRDLTKDQDDPSLSDDDIPF